MWSAAALRRCRALAPRVLPATRLLHSVPILAQRMARGAATPAAIPIEFDAPTTPSAPAPEPALPATFVDIGVSPFWITRLQALGIAAPTETQARALPHLLAGKDMIIKAETGSGKTVCYLLPILEAIRNRGAPADGAQMLATALVVVPTQELVRQVLQIAEQLLPEYASLFRPAFANIGVSREENCALIVATPSALMDNVNRRQLNELKFLVLDEADMLLSGTYFPVTQGYVLSIMKQREVESRPQHIFAAATLPAKGKMSTQAFLDTYYPEDEVMRVCTTGAHKSISTLTQRFIQLDSHVALTLEEREVAARLQAKATAAGEEAVAVAPTPGADVDVVTPPPPRLDSLARAMVKRQQEDSGHALKVDIAGYESKVARLRQHAVLRALLWPAQSQAPPSSASTGTPAGAAAGVSGATATAPVGAPGVVTSLIPSTRSSPGSRKHRSTSLLVSNTLTDAHARSGSGSGGGSDISTGEGAPTASATSDDVSSGVSSTESPSLVQPLGVPTSLSQTLKDTDVARIPPTLVFVNTADAAQELRRFLSAANPHLTVGELHKKVPDEARVRVVEAFLRGDKRVLVCTDLASRGLDTTRVQHVIQAEFASDVITHLHRIGRTARAGRPGLVTNLLIRANLNVVDTLLRAAAAGDGVDGAVSHRRSFRKGLKKAAVRTAQEAAIMRVLEAEQAELYNHDDDSAAPPARA